MFAFQFACLCLHKFLSGTCVKKFVFYIILFWDMCIPWEVGGSTDVCMLDCGR